MRAAARLAAALTLLLPSAARAGDEHASVEVVASRASYFVQQPIRLRIRIRYDVAWFDRNAARTHLRRTDVPFQVHAPWTQGLAGTTSLAGPDVSPARGVVQVALDDAVVDAARGEDETRDGRRFAVVEIARSFLPTASGELVVQPTEVRYSSAAGRTEDFTGAPLVEELEETVVACVPLRLRVDDLPAEGRPGDFAGAVGTFTVTADASPREVAVGASVRVVLDVEGDGNVATFGAPALDVLPGFHLLGTLDDHGSPRRRITYDLAPLTADARSVPAIRLPYFDPGPPAGYRVVETAPIPITVRGATGATSPVRHGESPAADERGPAAVVIVAAALLLVAVAAWVVRRVRGQVTADRDLTPSLDAADVFRDRVAIPGADVADALTAYLGARLRCSPAAVIAPDLASRLAGARVPGDVAEKAAALVERLVAARYGGGAPSDAAAQARSVVEEIEAALGPRDGTRDRAAGA